MADQSSLFVLNKTYKPQHIVKCETINMNALKYYLANEKVVKELDYPEEEQGFFRKGKKSLLGILKTYKSNLTTKGIQTIYTQSDKHNTGRFSVNDSAGLQMIEKSIRHTLAKDIYIDLDFKNCHPVILKQLCEFNNWDCKNLTYYVENRETCIDDIVNASGCSKGDAKMNVLRILNGGKAVNKANTVSKLDLIHENLKNLSWYTELNKEIILIHSFIWKNYTEYATIANNKLKKNIYNLQGSCFNHFITDIENQCLLAFEDFLIKNKFQPDVLCFDGIMVKIDKDNLITQEILIKAQEFIKEVTNFSLEIVEKPMDLYINLPEEEPLEDDLVDDNYACNIFCELMGDNLVCFNNSILIFNEDNGIWTDEKGVLLKAINKHKNSLVFKRIGPMGFPRIHDYGGSYTNINNMLKFVSTYAPTNDNFWEDNIETSIGKLLFEDGIYDYETKTFTKGFNNKIVFKSNIPREYNGSPTKESIDFVNRVLFEEPFEDNSDGKSEALFLKRALARGIYGDYKAKAYYMLLGLSNSGKGVTSGAMISAFGRGYVKTFNSENLYYNKNSADEEMKNRWLLDICYGRLAFSNEMDTENKIVNTVVLKKITSGGDENRARGLFKEAVSFVNRSTMFLFGNDCPAMKPYDEATQRRGNFIDMPFQFVENPDPTNAIQKSGIYDIKDRFRDNDDLKDALVYIMIEAYHNYTIHGNEPPPGVIKAEQDWNAESVSVERVLLEEYTIVKDPTVFVPFCDLIDYFTSKKYNISSQKLGKEIAALTGFKSEVKKIDKKCVRVCLGLIERDDDDDAM